MIPRRLSSRFMTIPLRLCVECRTLHPRSTLHRLVWQRQGDLLCWNPPSTVVGRSVYVCQAGGCLTAVLSGQKGRKLAKALKRPIPHAILESLTGVLDTI
jgi:predicted RNA-binding protein YlxR (DUF448 family)